MLASAPYILAVNPNEVPAKTIKEFIDFAKAKLPTKLNWGSTNKGSPDHLAGELFSIMAGSDEPHSVSWRRRCAARRPGRARPARLFLDTVIARPCRAESWLRSGSATMPVRLCCRKCRLFLKLGSPVMRC
jgi:hypothetical protein